MFYRILVIDSDGDLVVTKYADEHPSEDYLNHLVEIYGAAFCDVSRREDSELTLEFV